MGVVLRGGKPYWDTQITFQDRVSFTFGTSLPTIPSGRILDLGCSTGQTTDELSRLYQSCKVIGMDMHPATLRLAKMYYPTSEFLAGDGYDMSSMFQTKFAAVFAMNNIGFVISEFTGRDLRRALRSITDCVEEDGYLVLSRCEQYVIFQCGKPIRLTAAKQYERGVDISGDFPIWYLASLLNVPVRDKENIAMINPFDSYNLQVQP